MSARLRATDLGRFFFRPARTPGHTGEAGLSARRDDQGEGRRRRHVPRATPPAGAAPAAATTPSGSAVVRASSRASRPLWALLKWLTTARVPSLCSLSTRTVTAPGTGASAAYEPLRRSTTRSSIAASDPGERGFPQRPQGRQSRAGWYPRTAGRPGSGHRRGRRRTAPSRRRAGGRPGPAGPASSRRRPARRRGRRCSAAPREASGWCAGAALRAISSSCRGESPSAARAAGTSADSATSASTSSVRTGVSSGAVRAARSSGAPSPPGCLVSEGGSRTSTGRQATDAVAAPRNGHVCGGGEGGRLKQPAGGRRSPVHARDPTDGRSRTCCGHRRPRSVRRRGHGGGRTDDLRRCAGRPAPGRTGRRAGSRWTPRMPPSSGPRAGTALSSPVTASPAGPPMPPHSPSSAPSANWLLRGCSSVPSRGAATSTAAPPPASRR